MRLVGDSAYEQGLWNLFTATYNNTTDAEWDRNHLFSEMRTYPELFISAVNYHLIEVRGHLTESEACFLVRNLSSMPGWLRDNREGFSVVDGAVFQVMFMAGDSEPLQTLYKSVLRSSRAGFTAESQAAYHIHQGSIPEHLLRLTSTRAELEHRTHLYVAIAALLLNQALPQVTESIIMQLKAQRAIRTSRLIVLNYATYHLFLSKQLTHARPTAEVSPERVRLAAALHLLLTGESRAVADPITTPVKALLFGGGITESFMNEMFAAEVDSVKVEAFGEVSQ